MSQPSRTWLSRRRDEWLLTGEVGGPTSLPGREDMACIPATTVRSGLDRHFDQLTSSEGAYFFPACDGTRRRTDEAGRHRFRCDRATSIWYVGQRR